MTWRLASQFHLPDLNDDECLWSPVPGADTVRPDATGRWRADWNDEDPDSPSPVTIGWLTWHLLWWWDELLTRARGQQPPARQDVFWPGTANDVRKRLYQLSDGWAQLLGQQTETDLDRPFAFPWPEPQPFVLAAAWANSELMKSIAEIGVIRHQYRAFRAGKGST